MINNSEDVFLLNNNPNKLVLKYLPIIKSLVVKKLITQGYFQDKDLNDKVQEIFEGLLTNIEKIKNTYNGYSKFKPFFIKIIINRCHELKRKEFRQETREIVVDNPDKPEFEKKIFYINKYNYVRPSEEKFQSNNNDDPDKDVLLESELEYLDIVFRMYPLRRVRLLICLKILLDREVTEDELKLYFNGCKHIVYRKVIEQTANIENLTKTKKFQILNDFFNSCDKTNKTYDAVRKEIDKMLPRIIGQMNSVSIPSIYNGENILGLIGMYFDWKIKNNS